MEVRLWSRNPGHAAALRQSRSNQRYLPGIALPAALEVTSDLSLALRDAQLALLAAPVSALRESLQRVSATGADLPAIWLCKGIEQGSALLPHQIADAVLGPHARRGALAGPSFAVEVAQGLPCALTLAARDVSFARSAAELLHGGRLRVYFSTDVVGVEVGSAIKNVMAIAVGVCDGLGLGQNARAALITRGLAEIARLGVALGGAPETFLGLSGAGDLVLTCTGDLSRNRRVGLALARGEALERILADLGHVAEGVHAAREVTRLAAAHGVDMPISEAVAALLSGRIAARKAVELLLARDPGAE